jgi:alkanesulfonate monooxygenase SsuD/methylene tetrahydromethanopterin reductase-like flavin-dependent oxidoreductase (luciferase family)
VAETDAEALALARRAYLKWIESFMYLWKLRGGIPPNANFPPTWDDMAARGQAFCGSPSTMRDILAKDIPASGINYLLCRFAFGDMVPEESRRSVELFVREVMPAFARETVAA